MVHKADLGNGCYMNPIFNGDYPDPAVFREDEDYFLCATTGRYLPGLTIYQSGDLVNWKIICHPLVNFDKMVWAPDILKCKDKYYIYFNAENTNYVMWSEHISYGWSEPIDLRIGLIDPGHVEAFDGNRYLFLSENHLVPLSEDGLSVCGEPRQVLKAPDIPMEWEIEGHFPEAPNVFKKDGYYYLTYADGGTAGPATSHMIMSARAKNLEGPWEMSPYNPVVRTWNREEKWVSKGHGHFVEDTEGNWWVIYHAYENGYESLGRKLLLSPVDFTKDGWFQIIYNPDVVCKKPKGSSVLKKASLSDDFSGSKLKESWQAWGEEQWDRYVQKENQLIVQAVGDCIGESHPLTVNTGDHSYEVQVYVEADNRCKAGLIIQYNERYYNALSLENKWLIIYRFGEELARVEVGESKLWLKLINNDQYLSFHYSTNGLSYHKLPYGINLISQNTNAYGGFHNLRPGIYASGEGTAIFKEFIYTGLK